MKFKIQGGTAIGSDSLCLRCKERIVVRGANNESFIGCRAITFERNSEHVPFQVSECNSFKDEKHIPLREMQQMAWIVRTDASGKKIGFARMTELAEEDKKKAQDDISRIIEEHDDY